MSEPILSVSKLNFGWNDRQLFKNLSFALQPGTMTSVIGPNGVGKTTLIRLLMGQLTPASGTISWQHGVKVGYVPQFRNLDDEYPLTIRAFVQLSQQRHLVPWHSAAEQKRLDEVLAATHLTHLQNQCLGMASGGEKQKAYLAQALIDNPSFLVLDEATASLDVATKVELMDLVKELNQKMNLTVLFITHDMDLAKQYTQQYLLIEKEGAALMPIDFMNPESMPKELRPTVETEDK
ncbi:ATP-binding cassette domain-containing protein [Lacticaseibacillus pabuli]|uniref:ATP-binding cassette domain-containing protein n=1 Tax=Lacticaseibacillus pabuli TaxID=3025672 RepID=A0ABY7WSX7_9LACO|nr:ATP-binding cassette domain-containing protein [Lacticaseibacillus sp. KACC 23028]WDF82538.1 ATP-binding cassette domain-containing protein [Lacticaseibacillus sp. KACC 23028]